MQDYALGQVEQNSKVRARQLCNALQSLGPSFVKIGQALSSRPDLLPQIYLEVGYLLSVLTWMSQCNSSALLAPH